MTETDHRQALRLRVDPIQKQIVASSYGLTPHRLHHSPTTLDDLELLVADDGTHAGFCVFDYDRLAIAGDDPVLWEVPRFVVPVLHPQPRCIGYLTLQARAWFGSEGTPDVVLALEAESREADGDLEAALSCWYETLGAGHLGAHLSIGRLLLDLGDGHRARAHLIQAMEFEPSDGLTWLLLGGACEACGDVDDARRAYVAAVRHSSDDLPRVRAMERLNDLGPSRRLWEEEWPMRPHQVR